VKASRADDLAAYHQNYFAPNNATLAIVGDVKAAEIPAAGRKKRSAAGSSASSAAAASTLPRDERRHRASRRSPRLGAEQHHRCQARPAREQPRPRRTQRRQRARSAAASADGSFQNLREKNGWTYGAYSAFDMNRFGGDFSASAETRNAVTAPAIRETLKEIDRLRDEPCRGGTRSSSAIQHRQLLCSASRTAAASRRRVQDIELYGLPADFYKTYARRMAAVTPRKAGTREEIPEHRERRDRRRRRSEGSAAGAGEDREGVRVRSGVKPARQLSAHEVIADASRLRPPATLHLGHARTFWTAQERALAAGGTLILRNDDLDRARCKPEFVERCIEDLRWFGFRWSEGPDVGGPCRPTTKARGCRATSRRSSGCANSGRSIRALLAAGCTPRADRAASGRGRAGLSGTCRDRGRASIARAPA
jgi:hypothetical protein